MLSDAANYQYDVLFLEQRNTSHRRVHRQIKVKQLGQRYKLKRKLSWQREVHNTKTNQSECFDRPVL